MNRRHSITAETGVVGSQLGDRPGCDGRRFARRPWAVFFSLLLLGWFLGRATAAESPAVAANARLASTAPEPPVITALRSPLRFFRELLTNSPPGREQQLATRSPESRKVIVEKIREYEALSEDERELRLRTTELSWYLKQLRDLEAAQRARLLSDMPATDRQFLEVRLAYWDNLPADQQRRLLNNEAALKYIVQLRSGHPGARSGAGPELAEELNQLRRLGPAERERILEQFKQLFELNETEREKVLDRRVGPERAELERALNVLQQLPTEKQPAYVEAVSRFTTMSRLERAEFLKSAERWKGLSAEERAAWRALFTQFPDLPPLPPGEDRHSLPPLPPDGAPRVPQQATNSPVPPNPGA